jgi:hypothetical protein
MSFDASTACVACEIELAGSQSLLARFWKKTQQSRSKLAQPTIVGPAFGYVYVTPAAERSSCCERVHKACVCRHGVTPITEGPKPSIKETFRFKSIHSIHNGQDCVV